LRKIDGSTSLLIRHLKRQHEDLFNSCVKVKLENPELPDIGDAAHPIWQFFQVTTYSLSISATKLSGKMF
jgi:hypothetical protein